ncbi:hypothetical protein GCM10009804_65020 [Kribbella hippodromi]|uniref:Uncharacterized protein n=1 Tax=Kribbella hippodromi TaxID=434347 RepID=A0ABN2E874_9ACTN
MELRWFEPAEGQRTTVSLPAAGGGVAAVIELALQDGQVRSRVLEGTCDRYTVKLSSTRSAAENTA